MYNDVPRNSKFYDAIEFLQYEGIMTGNENGDFQPRENIEKAELCVIISNLLDSDYDFYRIDNTQIPKHIPTWVHPYFSALNAEGLLPNDFEKTLKIFASEQDLLDIFNQIRELYLPKSINFNSLESLSKTSECSLLTRERCAFLIFRFCKGIAIPILENLKDPKAPAVAEVLPIFVKHSWIDYFYNQEYFDINLYQIYYMIKHFSRRNLTYVQQQLDIMLEINHKRDDYFLYKTDNPIYHYTTLKTMETLTKPNATFRLSNSVYLNDPQEGFLSFSLLAKKSAQKKYRNLRDFLLWFQSTDSDASPYFIASFIKTADSLPMWVHYGAGGSGCCLGINEKDLCDDVYTVTYDKSHISKFFTEILDILNSYITDHPEIQFHRDPVFQYAKKIINQSCYLYKDSAYKYEQEVRIIRFVPLKSAIAEDIGEIFPKIYWETPLQSNRLDNIGIRFSSIILGPTVENPARIATALAQRGYDSSIVKKSKIKFR